MKVRDLAKLKETVAVFSFLYKQHLLIYLFIYSWLPWVFVAVCRLSLVVVSRGYSLGAVGGFLIVAASPIAEHRL